MTAASNSEARKRAAGVAASNPAAPEPAPTLVDAPGADSEALAAREADLAGLTAWFHRDFWSGHCLHWGDGHSQCGSWAAAVLGSSWLADHDRQTAERAWFECLQAITWATNNGPDPIEYVAANNPYSQEARRG